MDRCPGPHYMQGMSIGTCLFTWLRGSRIGADAEGNTYYEERRARPGLRRRRWVMYAGREDASRIPPEWHAWLHYLTSAPLAASERPFWQAPHRANPTGTAESYRPAAADSVAAEYEAWSPQSPAPGAAGQA